MSMTLQQLHATWERDLALKGFTFGHDIINDRFTANYRGVRITAGENDHSKLGGFYAECYQFLAIRKKVKDGS